MQITPLSPQIVEVLNKNLEISYQQSVIQKTNYIALRSCNPWPYWACNSTYNNNGYVTSRSGLSIQVIDE